MRCASSTRSSRSRPVNRPSSRSSARSSPAWTDLPGAGATGIAGQGGVVSAGELEAMANRWMRPEGTPPDKTDQESTARTEGVLPPGAVESWRTWLLTGNPGVVSDRRRLRGSHRSLKQMLVDGTGQEVPQSWKHFSGAMVRLAINDALNALPKDQTHVVWLAYFAGLSNRQLARRLGISVGAVQRRLNVALEHVSEYVEQ